MFRTFSKMPLILVFIIILVVAFGNYIPQHFAEILYGISLTIKSFIIFVLPLMIFCLLFKASVNLAKDASKVIILILGGVVVSNFTTTTLSSLIVGNWIYNFDMTLIKPNFSSGLEAKEFVIFPSLMPNQYALFAGIIFGILAGKYNVGGQKLSIIFDKFVSKLLAIITILIPIFVAGFIIKLYKDDVIFTIIRDYSIVFIVIAISTFSYIIFLYHAIHFFNISSAFNSVRSMFPAMISAFSTMSSAASMPLTIMGVDSQAKNRDLAHTVIPATVNIHLIGDCVAIPCFAYAILKNYGMPLPDISTYLVFVGYFVMAKFSVAAVPGGGIIVMLPILQEYLGFTPEMMSLITALYILFDPIITSANVLGNGAFALIIDKLMPAGSATHNKS